MSDSAEQGADWLARDCAALFDMPDTEHRAAGARLGACAADSGVHLNELVSAVLQAATAKWQSTGANGATAEKVHTLAGNLLDAAQTVALAALDGYVRQTRAELDRHEGERTAFINALLAGKVDPGRLAERANRYGIRLSASHTVLIGRGDGITPAMADRIDAALAARFGTGNTLTTLRNGDLICISSGGLRGIGAELSHQLLAELGAGRWQVAVGRAQVGLHGIAASLEEAHNTLEHAAQLGFTAPLLNAADLLVFPVLLRDRAAITDLVTTVLGPLTTARGGAGLYLSTLGTLFDNQGNYTATARHLHLSVRAVTYRLDRIRELTGYHPGEPTQRFTLQAAVLGARLLGWPPSVKSAE